MALRYRTLSLSLRYDTVLFPFETLVFLRSLTELGYMFPEPEQPPLGSRVDAGGTLGRKGGASVHLDPNKMMVGVSAPDPESLVAEFDAVERLIETRFGFNSNAAAKFYEVLAGAVVESGNSPLEALARIGQSIPLIEALGPILGTELSPYGLKLGPRGQGPNQVDWFDVLIEPDIQSNDRLYRIEVVYRRARRQDVVEFARALSERIQAIVATVER